MAAKGSAARSASGAAMSKYDVEVEKRLQALEAKAHTPCGGGGDTSGNTMSAVGGSFLDSPATTSAITYGLGGFSNNTNTSAYNRRVTDAAYGQVTEIILMEVSA